MVKNQLHRPLQAKTILLSKHDLYVQWSINRWPFVHQVYLVVQLGLGENSCPRSAHGLGHILLCGIFGENQNIEQKTEFEFFKPIEI